LLHKPTSLTSNKGRLSMTNQNTLSMVGTIAEIEEKTTSKGKPFIRARVTDGESSKWMSAFDESVISAVKQVANGNDQVNIRYTESMGNNGYTNINIRGVSFNKERQVTPKSPPPSSPEEREAIPYMIAPALTQKDRAIIRQVAFKDVLNKDDKSAEKIAELTDIYEQILIGTFPWKEGSPLDGLDDSAFINNPDETVQDF